MVQIPFVHLPGIFVYPMGSLTTKVVGSGIEGFFGLKGSGLKGEV